MYIDTGLGQSNPIIITVITSGAAYPRTWRIRVTQIPCQSISKADQGCLQFHTGVYGRVRSFNFDTSTGRQLSNQDYSVCIRTERNFCSIQYQVCPDQCKWFKALCCFFMRTLAFCQQLTIGLDRLRFRETLIPWSMLWWAEVQRERQMHAPMIGC